MIVAPAVILCKFSVPLLWRSTDTGRAFRTVCLLCCAFLFFPVGQFKMVLEISQRSVAESSGCVHGVKMVHLTSCILQRGFTCSSRSSGSIGLLQPCPRPKVFRPFQTKQRSNSAQLCKASDRASSAADTSATDLVFGHLNRRQLLQIAGTSALIFQHASETKVWPAA